MGVDEFGSARSRTGTGSHRVGRRCRGDSDTRRHLSLMREIALPDDSACRAARHSVSACVICAAVNRDGSRNPGDSERMPHAEVPAHGWNWIGPLLETIMPEHMPHEPAKTADMIPVIARVHESLHLREMIPACRARRPNGTSETKQPTRVARQEDVGPGPHP